MPLQKWSDQIWVSQMSSEPAFSDELEAIYSAFNNATFSPDLVLDLSSVESLNSASLNRMLNLSKIVHNAGARIRIAAPSTAAWTLLLTTGLDRVFHFAHNTPTALADLQLNP